MDTSWVLVFILVFIFLLFYLMGTATIVQPKTKPRLIPGTSGAAAFYSTLIDLGVQTIFGVCGAATYAGDEVLQQFIDSGKLKYYHTTNECTAVYASSAYWYFTDRPAAFSTTAGPGMASAIPGVMAMYNEQYPCIGLMGDEADSITQTILEFQTWNPSILDTFTKYKTYYLPMMTAMQISTAQQNALQIARSGIPGDYGSGPSILITEPAFWTTELSTANRDTEPPTIPTEPAPTQVDAQKVWQFFNGKRRVLVMLGPRVSNESAKALLAAGGTDPNSIFRFCSLYTSRQALLEYGYPNYLDMSGPLGVQTAENAENLADAFLILGEGVVYSTLGDIITNRDILQILNLKDTQSSVSGKVNTIRGHVEEYAKLLAQTLPRTTNGNWPKEITLQAAIQDRRKTVEEYMKQNNTLSQSIAYCVHTLMVKSPYYLNDNDICMITDVGAAAFVAGALWRSNHYLNRNVFGQFSQIGCSPTWATGAMYAKPKSKYLLFTGDGGLFNMFYAGVDLANAVQMTGSTCFWFILNDHQYTNVAMGEELLFGHTTSISSTQPLQQGITLQTHLQSLNPKLLTNDRPDAEMLQAFAHNRLTPGLYIFYLQKAPTVFITTKSVFKS